MSSILMDKYRLASAANATSGAFTAKTPTATEPSGAKIFKFASLGLANGSYGPRQIKLMPFGGNDDNDTFDMRVWGWSQIRNPGVANDNVWIPQLLVTASCTLGNISATSILASSLLCDTITVGAGAADNADWRVLISPTGDVAATLVVHPLGSEIIEFDFDLTGTGDGANTLWKVLDDG